MADVIITKQELIDAQKDAKTLEDVINGAADTQVTARMGRTFWTLATLNSKLNSVETAATQAIASMNLKVVGVEAVATQGLININNDVASVEAARVVAESQMNAKVASVEQIFDDKLFEWNDEAQTEINEWRSAISLITQEGGVPALAVSDASGKTQQQINNSITTDSSLSVVSGFLNNNADQVLSFLQFNKMMAKFQPGSEISIEKPIVVDLTGTESAEIDLQGATLNFKTGGKLTFRGKSTPYLTTNVTTDLIRGGTNFKVSSIAGVAIGDLIVVKSPVALTAGVTLSQTYLVQGVDAATNTIFVMGYIVGDIRADKE